MCVVRPVSQVLPSHFTGWAIFLSFFESFDTQIRNHLISFVFWWIWNLMIKCSVSSSNLFSLQLCEDFFCSSCHNVNVSHFNFITTWQFTLGHKFLEFSVESGCVWECCVQNFRRNNHIKLKIKQAFLFTGLSVQLFDGRGGWSRWQIFYTI